MYIDPTAAAKIVYQQLKDKGLQRLNDAYLQYGQIRILDESGRFTYTFYVSNEEVWCLHFHDTGETNRGTLSASTTTAEALLDYILGELNGLNVVFSTVTKFKPRTVYPADEQQELCL